MRNDPVADGEDPGAGDRTTIADAPVIEGYTIERELGRGGEAIVYLAREHALDRRVALKVLRPERAASIHADRFVQEIALIARLTHTNILPLHSAGRSNGVLYYTGRFVEGESLRARIAREKQLSIAEALRIAREVASALDFACRNGVVHRDIKPENILLGDGHAIVADFGIARAVDRASDHRLTAPGLGVGTVLYMSPEQAGGEADVDGRSDIYSLGCVLYEMLIGSPPFHGSSASNIIAHHMASPVPSLRDVRPTVSRALEDVIMRALAKTPADRYATAAEFAEALANVSALPQTSPWLSRRAAALVAGAVIAGLLWTWRQGANADQGDSSPAVSDQSDTSRYAVLVMNGGAGNAIGGLAVDEMVREALKRWADIEVADQMQARNAMAERSASPNSSDARAVAVDLNVGRFVRLHLSSTPDSIRVDAALIHTSTGAILRDSAIRIPRERGGAEAGIQRLVNHLVLNGTVAPARAGQVLASRSLRAQQAYLRGHASLERWDLADAAYEFRTAADRDPEFSQAWLWLAQVQLWMNAATQHWQGSVDMASRRRGQLTTADSLRLEALLATAAGAADRACSQWSRLVDLDRNEFAAHYAEGQCLANDSVVVRDNGSPTGWRFRTSYKRALDAYQRAFRLQPAIHQSFRGGSAEDIRKLLRTNSNQVRGGIALPPDTLTFRAYPSWNADSLAFIPIVATELANAHRWVRSEDVRTAVSKQRELFHDLAGRWRVALPRSPDALEAVAVALDLLGNRSGLDSLQAARRLATERDDRMRMATMEIWMRVKFSAPTDIAGLRGARSLADSLLRAHVPADPAEARLLAGLAALIGRADLAAEHNRIADAATVPAAIAQAAPALIAFAALGGPADTMHALERDVERALRTTLTTPARAEARRTLARAALLALPEHRFDSIPALVGPGASGALLLAWNAGDLVQARRVVDSIRTSRRAGLVRASDVTLDMLRAEAAVLASLGDARAAAVWLAPTLDSLALTAPQTLASVTHAGSLVRAMALRAGVAAELGDRATARAWARAVLALWSKPDPFLAPTIRRMRTLSR